MISAAKVGEVVGCWRIIRNIFLLIVFVIIVLFIPISWPKNYKEGVNLRYLAKNVTDVVDAYYAPSWEREELINESDPRIKSYERSLSKGAISSMQLVSRRQAHNEPQIYINVEQLETDADQFDFNLAGLLADRLNFSRKVDTFGKAVGLKSNANSVDCGCIEKVDDIYPVCSSTFIYKPYRVEVTIYRSSTQCVGRDSYKVPTVDIKKFTQMSQQIESAIKAELLPGKAP